MAVEVKEQLPPAMEDEPLELRVWDHLKQKGSLGVHLNERVTCVRFMSVCRGFREIAKVWLEEQMHREFLGIETDVSAGKNFEEKLMVESDTIKQASEDGTTAPAVTSVDAKLLRGAAQCNLVVSNMIFQHRVRLRYIRIFGAVWAATETSHGTTNELARSVQGNRQFYLEQLNGAHTKEIVDILHVFMTPATLIHCGFMGTDSAMEIGEAGSYELAVDEECATLMADGAVCLAARRSRRRYYFQFGYPSRLYNIVDPAKAVEVTKTFRVHLDEFNWLASLEGAGKEVGNIVARSQFPLTAVKQFEHGLAEYKWDARNCPDVVDLAEDHLSASPSSQVVEDLFAVEKNNKRVKGSKLFRTPPRAMGIAIGSHVVDHKHAYLPVPTDTDIRRDLTKIDKTTFGVKAPAPSIDTSGVWSFKKKADWYAPGVPDLAPCLGPVLDFSHQETQRS